MVSTSLLSHIIFSTN